MIELEKYTTGTGQKIWVHSKEICLSQHCCIHNPSPHHMVDWPTNWRGDTGVMERIDPRNVGHPDPDDLVFRQAVAKERKLPKPKGVHGCNGLCNPYCYKNYLKEKIK
jgi:hypothetical protein